MMATCIIGSFWIPEKQWREKRMCFVLAYGLPRGSCWTTGGGGGQDVELARLWPDPAGLPPFCKVTSKLID